MLDRTFILADGENLVIRYEASIKKEGIAPRSGDTFHIENCFVWHRNITRCRRMEVIRASYYTTVFGDDQKIDEVKMKIASFEYDYVLGAHETHKGRICPHIFKKERTRQKTKSVDINLTIDALRHTYNDSLDILFLLSGDGDYIPLIQEVMRQGKKVLVGAFSEGLNPALRHVPDDFICLDDWMLMKK